MRILLMPAIGPSSPARSSSITETAKPGPEDPLELRYRVRVWGSEWKRRRPRKAAAQFRFRALAVTC